MLLYTIMPYDVIFGQTTQETGVPAQSGTSVTDNGLVEWTRAGGEVRVSRLISTDPSAYLRAEYMPGAPWAPKG